MTEKFFVSVVFYRADTPSSLELKSTLSSSELLKVFTSVEAEEIQQIVNMSDRTAIISDHEELNRLKIREGKATGRGKFRKFLMDWGAVDLGRIGFRLNTEGITIVKTEDIQLAIEKLELFLFACVNVHTKKTFIEPNFSKNQFGKYFFTHFLFHAQSWKTMISTHERERNISELLGKDWEILTSEVLRNSPKYKKPNIEVLIKPFLQVIYPHIVDGELKRLTLGHLTYDSQIDENLTKFYKFLETIK